MPTIRKDAPFKGVWDAIDALADGRADLVEVRTALVALAADHDALQAARNKVNTPPGVANGSTAGKFQHTGDPAYEINGICYGVSATDDAWDLTGLDACAADEWHGVALCVNAAGAYSIVEGNYSDVSAADALATCLAAVGSSVAVVGVFVGGNSCDFTSALSDQGALYQGRPVATATYSAPAAVSEAAVTLVNA